LIFSTLAWLRFAFGDIVAVRRDPVLLVMAMATKMRRDIISASTALNRAAALTVQLTKSA
jgi:hypothetical protein